MSTMIVTLPPIQEIPEIQAAAAEAAAFGQELMIDYVVPRHDYEINIYIPDHNLLVPYVVIHRESIVKLTLTQVIGLQNRTHQIHIPYSATYVPVLIPTTGEIRHCFVGAHAYNL
jgi:hypothetical protein